MNIKSTMLLLFVFFIIGNYYCLADNYIFETNKLPDIGFMPTLANGHLGVVALGDSILINGLYNGETGHSHRARIPNFANIQFEQCSNATTVINNCLYSLNLRDGIFKIIYTGPEFSIEQTSYAHRYFDRLFVNQITITRNSGFLDEITVNLYMNEGEQSEDVNLHTFETVTGNRLRINGNTIEMEDSTFQSEYRPVSILYDLLPNSIRLNASMTTETFTYRLSAGFTNDETANDYNLASQLTAEELLLSHTQQWHRTWTEMDVSVMGDDYLDKIIHSSMFFLFSSLPSLNTSQQRNTFYGLSPSGLGKGGLLLHDYQGHSFWDTEIWMQPVALLFEPKWSAELLHYRYLVREAAAQNANKTEFKGLRYPWESGYTGVEVTPPCCPEVVKYQHHITADIAFAARQYLFATHDFEWLKTEGCELAYRTAEFWESHAILNERGSYDILAVMGPDEDELDGVNNNGYTNVIAGYNLYFGEFASCVCSGSEYHPDDYEIIDKWSKIAKNLHLEYDEELDYHPAHDAFELTADREIKQADTILMGYPLELPMAESTKRNNLHTYGNLTRLDGPAMTWSMHVIGHLDLDEVTEATALFNRSYQPYIREPFNIWSEAMDGVAGAGNFITGAGGFLQLILNGYGGVRLRMDYMEIAKPRLPPATNRFTITGIKYLDSVFGITVERVQLGTIQTKQTVQITKLGSIELNITLNDVEVDVALMKEYVLETSAASIGGDILKIQSKQYGFGECQIPNNEIGSGEISSANTMKINLIAITLIMIFMKLLI